MVSLHAFNAGGPGSIAGQETRSQLRVHMPQLKILCAAIGPGTLKKNLFLKSIKFWNKYLSAFQSLHFRKVIWDKGEIGVVQTILQYVCKSSWLPKIHLYTLFFSSLSFQQPPIFSQ